MLTTSCEAVLQVRKESDVSQSGAKAKSCMGSGWNGSTMEIETPSQEALGWEGEQKSLGTVHPEGQELKESEKQVNNGWGCFPGGSVVKNLPCNTGDMGSIPGHAEQLSLHAATREPMNSNKDSMYSN